jgi:hypothetical protein
MKIVIPVSERDLELAEAQSQLIHDLGGVSTHSCLLVVVPKISHRDGKIAQNLQKAFGSFSRFIVPNVQELGGPPNKYQPHVWAANQMFAKTVQHLQSTNNKDEWYWLEPDCVPLDERWADELGRDYLSAAATNRPFMGRFIQKVVLSEGQLKAKPGETYMVGSGIYPPNLSAYSQLWAHAKSVPFDVLMQWETSKRSTPTEKILHNHATGNYKVDKEGNATCDALLTPTRSLTKLTIPPTALVFHGCKDTSLIDWVRATKLDPPEKPKKPKKGANNFVVENS